MSQKGVIPQSVRYTLTTRSSPSRFKVKDLLDLNNPSKAYLSPLAVISHIDVNAFFAQVERNRLGLSTDDAVVCVQWSSLIAVSYKAREFGISRMDTLESAKLKCPILKPVHTAVFKKGQNFWRYHDDEKEFPSPKGYKVSLDPYRRESRKILKIFKKSCDLVEKASVDECFMDLGRLVLQKLFVLIPGLHADIQSMDINDYLPTIPSDFNLDDIYGEVIPSDYDEGTPCISDWDDIVIFLGSQICYGIRKQIQEELGYTTSCGVGRVKTIAKLASGFKKPDNQTIIRHGSINRFLENFDFTDFWSMGGKTGEFIKGKLSPPTQDSIRFIRENYDLHELEDYLEDKQLASKLYNMIRGEYHSPLSERIVLRSMNSNKNIRGTTVSKLSDAADWIRVFASDLHQRLTETDDENGYRTRPKTISVHYRSVFDWESPHSKQSSLPIVPIDEMEELLYKYGTNLLRMLEAQYGKIYPLQNLNMTISNFEIMDGGEKSILNFTKKGDINDLFSKQIEEKEKKLKELEQKRINEQEVVTKRVNEEVDKRDETLVSSETPESYASEDGSLKCLKCDEIVIDKTEHDDFHYAIELTQQLNGAESLGSGFEKYQGVKSYGEKLLASRSGGNTNTKKRTKTTNKNDKKSKIDKSQSKLPF